MKRCSSLLKSISYYPAVFQVEELNIGKRQIITMKPLNVLSLFDGISCAQIALERAGFEVANYFASEIEKASIKITQHNYPNTIQLGNVTKIKAIDLPPIDLLIGGSPCQGFSSEGKKLNFNDPRSKLFFEYVRLLKECKPKWFLLENVGSMEQQHQDIISEQFGVQPVAINSRMFSAQVRNRVYWTNLDLEKPEKEASIVIFDIVEKNGKFNVLDDCKSVSRKYMRRKVYFDWRIPGVFGQYKEANYLYAKHSPITCAGTAYILCANGQIRKTSLLEQERLQTVPDGYTDVGICKTSRSKSIGNGFTVDVIVYILNHIITSRNVELVLQAQQIKLSDFEDLII
ncbi:hypothetical protein LCGC14_0378260 [marine sediment metagenome]|uniref:DNA (cytosine-5-)-methyltransferase n=1 Tax=marine sediment metagenome TaxID=412755 RepID=A0A0F9TLB8_9ZZZZ